ncbi:16469_t:CDS:2, partial [Cetraspora pellucida]
VNLDDFLLPEKIEDTTNPILTLESEIENTTDFNSTPMTKSLTNPFIGRTWKTQVDKMLTQLATLDRIRKDLNQKIQTYYYLRKLLDQHADPAMIKDFIERKQGKRKAKDTWH